MPNLQPKDIVIVEGARTAMVSYTGDFSEVSAIDLGAAAAKEAIRRSSFDPAEIAQCFMGNALQTSGDAIYGARHVALKAGLTVEAPALTVNRLCGSGIQSIVSAVHAMMTGECDAALAGGMENMTQAPHVIFGARKGFALGQGKMEDLLWIALKDSFCGFMMAETAENLARELKISRRNQDEFALQSQKRAAAAQEAGKFKDEIVAVEIKSRKGPRTVDTDTHLRPDTTLEGLQKLPAYFSKDGFVTAGNASGIVDGAAALVVCTAERAKAKGMKPMGRIVSWAVAGVEPRIMGIGPVPASRKALERASLKVSDMKLVEVNEAFAAQYLAVERELGLDREKTNVNGGAIALGHPLGATGTRLVHTLLLELRRRDGGYGLATACIGGGQGIAMVVEAM
jgi:acetyl-CoA acetyltransferase family protein